MKRSSLARTAEVCPPGRSAYSLSCTPMQSTSATTSTCPAIRSLRSGGRSRSSLPAYPERDASIGRIVHFRLYERVAIIWRLAGRKAALVCHIGNSRGNVGRALADPRQGRIEAALFDISVAYEIRQRVCGDHEHLVGHQFCAARDCAKTDAGEDVRIIALSRHKGFALELHRIVRAAACEQRAPPGMAVSLLGGAFRFRGRIGKRKYDRSIVILRHGLQHLGREGAADRRNADDRGRLERPDCGQEVV